MSTDWNLFIIQSSKVSAIQGQLLSIEVNGRTPRALLRVASFPEPPCLRMHKTFRYIFRKKLHTLPCPYTEDYTNQEYRAFFELDSSDDLNCLETQTWQYHSSKRTVQQKVNKLINQKGPLVATEYLSFFVHGL